jgi:hypothetical protein
MLLVSVDGGVAKNSKSVRQLVEDRNSEKNDILVGIPRAYLLALTNLTSHAIQLS